MKKPKRATVVGTPIVGQCHDAVIIDDVLSPDKLTPDQTVLMAVVKNYANSIEKSLATIIDTSFLQKDADYMKRTLESYSTVVTINNNAISPFYDTFGSVTGRMSVKQPNISVLPRRNAAWPAVSTDWVVKREDETEALLRHAVLLQRQRRTAAWLATWNR